MLIHTFLCLIFYVKDESHFSTLKFRAHIAMRYMRYNVCIYCKVCVIARRFISRSNMRDIPRVVYIVFYGDKLINKQRRQRIQTNTNMLKIDRAALSLVFFSISISLYHVFDHMVSFSSLWSFAFLVFTPSAIYSPCVCQVRIIYVRCMDPIFLLPVSFLSRGCVGCQTVI